MLLTFDFLFDSVVSLSRFRITIQLQLLSRCEKKKIGDVSENNFSLNKNNIKKIVYIVTECIFFLNKLTMKKKDNHHNLWILNI